jgi:formylglycine-generating enzyme required for sulfatase activity
VAAGRDNQPVTDVTYWDALRFVNWLDNGQPNAPEGPGTTETGTYSLTPTALAAGDVTRNPNSTWALPNLSEWSKAGYYDPASSSYFLYPTQSNTISTTQANYGNAVGDTTPVGSYPYPSYYGTYDQSGNVWQWGESTGDPSVLYYRLMGGAFDTCSDFLTVPGLVVTLPTSANYDRGFRVVQVPEPISIGIFGPGATRLLSRRRMRPQSRPIFARTH